MLRFAPVFSRSLAFFIRFFSLLRYSLGRVYITPPCKKYIFISLGYGEYAPISHSAILSPYSPPLLPSLSLPPLLPLLPLLPPRTQKEKRRGCYPSTL